MSIPPGLERDELRAVLEPLPRAFTLPSAAYTDAAVFAWEQRHIFQRDWLCVARERDVAEPGRYLRLPLTEAGVLLVRGADLRLRALHNVCAHRGTPIVTDDAGRLQRFVCPYHGWSYELNGTLRSAPQTEKLELFDKRDYGLPPVACDTWGGFVFVSLADDPPALADYLGNVPAHFRRVGLDQLVRGRTTSADVAANWKLLIENFQESHHFVRIHPELEHWTPWKDSSSFGVEPPWLGGTMDIVDEAETVSTSGKLCGRPLLPLLGGNDARKVHDCFLWPNLLTSVQPDYLLTYHLWPQGPALTRIVADIYFHPRAVPPAGSEPPASLRDVFDFWDVVNQQDRDICTSQQRGVASPGFHRGRYAASEDGMQNFDRLVVQRYLEGEAP